MFERSALANDLKEVFHGLQEGGGELNVAINGWIRLRLRIPLVCAPPSPHGHAWCPTD